jgi:hypothetical protein
MAKEEIRVGRRVWVRDPDATDGRSFGEIVSVGGTTPAGKLRGFVVKVAGKPRVIARSPDRRGKDWDFAD